MHGEQPIPNEINRQAAQWFAEQESGDMTPEDEARFVRWLAADPQHAEAYGRAQAVWRFLNAETLAPTPSAERRSKRRWPQLTRGRHRQWIGGALAASLALVAIMDSDIATRLRADAITATGEIREIRLPDGSTAMLDTDSAITFTSDGRTVRLLKGEAAFQVARDPRHPFSVNAGSGTSTALGTRFIVRRAGDGARVTVTEHSVRVAIARQSAVLREGQAIGYDAESLDQPQRVVVADADAWTRGRIRVVNRPLGEVVAEIARYHRGYIRVVGEDVARRPVSGTFDIRDPVGAIDVLQRTLGIGSTRLTDRIILLHA
ncbi:FecR family protein [Sphingobium terrigena]|uniref:FecR family protein n=1 Tax=Sphingobium terrigena TaxID=2304063 RepID=A0A418YUR0_9SPHN|nr:FecR family protein [Sphingobium terrigena]RJG55902.1 FecR family protein [Sphingobium terrigena]